MEPPLQILKGEDGILRDVYDRPMIVVFNAANSNLDAIKTSGPESSPFAFVHVDGSSKEDRAARTLIRSHVMQDHHRRKREKATQKRQSRHGKAVQASVLWADDLFGTCSLSPQPTRNLDPFAQYPIEMTARTHQLVNHCKWADYIICPNGSTDSADVTIIAGLAKPREFNYMSSFAVGMGDQALFHVLLLTSALHLCYLTGNVNWNETGKVPSTEIISRKLTAIRQVNEKLRDSPTAISDQLIHAVTFMAMVEVNIISI